MILRQKLASLKKRSKLKQEVVIVRLYPSNKTFVLSLIIIRQIVKNYRGDSDSDKFMGIHNL
jgi:hypothetical protein